MKKRNQSGMNHYMAKNIANSVKTISYYAAYIENSILKVIDGQDDVFYFAQDDNGRKFCYLEPPVKTLTGWMGPGKILMFKKTPFLKEWKDKLVVAHSGKVEYHDYVAGTDLQSKIKKSMETEKMLTPVKSEVSEGTKTLVERYPDRAFTKLPDDYGISSAYIDKVKTSKSRGIRFELDFNEFKTLFNIDKCAISGNKIGHLGKKKGMDQYSMDRMDASRGYVMDNIVIMAADLNLAKSNLDLFMMSEIDDEHKIEIMNRALHALKLRSKK